MRYLFLFCLVLLSISFSTSKAFAHGDHTHHTSTIRYLTTEDLKQWIDSGKKFVLIDARTKEYDDGRRIPGAIWMPFNSPKDELAKVIGKKDTLVVVYCGGQGCPASGWLSEILVNMGYSNVFDFPGGIRGWAEAGFPITHAE
jgi:rhodanese-related sulfurtransferase